MAENVLDRDRVEHASEEGAGGVAQVVETEWGKRGAIAGGDVPPAERGGVESVAGGIAEHVVVSACEIASLREPVERRQGLVGEREVASRGQRTTLMSKSFAGLPGRRLLWSRGERREGEP